jgi:16S rRNA (cytidine1402-2'-O)-methyltransferase
MTDQKSVKKGILYLVSTPIGNLDDITLRAIRILSEVDLILAEDTRTTGRLLKYLNIHKELLSYYSYNEERRIPFILRRLASGQKVALVSEAGTPSISDPGHKMVVAAIQNSFEIIPVPGSSAILAALVASGLPTDRFLFEGFLPRKKGRKSRLENLANEQSTIIIYESSLRIQKTVEDIVNIIGNRYIVLARELTKNYEEFIRGYGQDILEQLQSRKIKGEVVLLVAGKNYHPNLNKILEQ